VTGPDGKPVPVPTAQLRPNYGLATSSTVRENSGAGTRELVTRFVFDPLTTHLLATVSPTGARETKTYEDYDPATGQWGRPTSMTDPAGQTTRLSYASVGATAVDCAGSESVQSGALATITQPDGTTLSQVIDQGGGVARSTDGTTTSCVGTTEAPYAQASTVQGVGPSVLRTSYAFDGGSPLHLVARTTRAGGPTETEQTFLDSNGMPWQTIDATGTSTVSHWDPYTGRIDRVVETTRDGQQRSTSYTYAPGGGVATVAVDGRVLITNDYAPGGALLRSTLANGAVQTFTLDQNNNGRSAKTTFPDGTVIAETAEHSPSGRLLSRTVSGPTGSSTYTYDYNADGRLTAAKLAGAIPARATAWRNEYDGVSGRNGNRSSKTWTMADGTTQTTNFTYSDGNRLLTASSGRIAGTIEYDAAGRATRIGRDTIAYDAAGHVLSVGDGTRTYAFSDNGQTTTFTEQQDGETRSVTAKLAGRSLILGRDGGIEGQIVTVASGVTAFLAADGSVQRWSFDDMLGNTAWSSTGDAAPRLTHLYSPGGEPISVDRTTDPRSAIDLVADAVGWQSGHGASTLRLATPLVMIGSRVYTPDGGRWLEPDPSLNGSTNAYEYAVGDPINQVDPSGNASWGWLIGAVVATVVGLSIGAVTAGVGGGLAAQVAFGVVAGAVSGAGGEVATQLADSGGEFDGIDWASVGIAAGIGGAVGGIASGLAGSSTRALRAGRNTRALSANAPGEAVVAAEGESTALAGARLSSAVDDAAEAATPRFSRASYADESFGVEAASRGSVTSSRSSVALELVDSVDALPEKLTKDFTHLDRRIRGLRAAHKDWYRSEGKLIEAQYKALNRSIDGSAGIAFGKSLTPGDQIKLADAYLNVAKFRKAGDRIGAARQMEKFMSLDIFAAPPPAAVESLPGGWRW
jgi:RHS repeat-associated protein